jgi:hypothetical protein
LDRAARIAEIAWAFLWVRGVQGGDDGRHAVGHVHAQPMQCRPSAMLLTFYECAAKVGHQAAIVLALAELIQQSAHDLSSSDDFLSTCVKVPLW